jgi:hypothetical protein
MSVDRLPPTDRDPDEVRRLAEEILSDPRYDEPPTPLMERFWGWVADRIAELLELLASGGGGGLLAWAILLLALAVVAFAVWRAVRAWPRSARAREEGVASMVELTRSPAAWRDEAERLEAEGRWAEGLLCRYRALVGELVADGAIPDAPGRTAREYVADVRGARPAGADAFAEATDLFESVWYGAAPSGPAEAQRLSALERAVLSPRAREGAGR